MLLVYQRFSKGRQDLVLAAFCRFSQGREAALTCAALTWAGLTWAGLTRAESYKNPSLDENGLAIKIPDDFPRLLTIAEMFLSLAPLVV